MPTQRLSMRRIKQLLTMRFGAGASTREIARELGVAPSTVREYLGRVATAGIGWPLAPDVTDESLMARLFVNAGVRAGARYHAEPDWPALVRELKRPGVNLMVLLCQRRSENASVRRSENASSMNARRPPRGPSGVLVGLETSPGSSSCPIGAMCGGAGDRGWSVPAKSSG